MGEADIIFEFLGQACRSALDLFPGDNNVAGVAIEFLCILAC
jgi:hypothetical protein